MDRDETLNHSPKNNSLESTNRDFVNKIDQRRSYDQDTENIRQSLREEISRLQSEKFHAMVKAAEHAGNIGLVYHAKENTFARVVIIDELPPIPEIPPTAYFNAPDTEVTQTEYQDKPVNNEESESDSQAAIAEDITPQTLDQTNSERSSNNRPIRPTLPIPPTPLVATASDASGDRKKLAPSIVTWVASGAIGLFVGISLFSLTGISKKTSEGSSFFYLFMLIGIAAILVIKLLLESLWYIIGRSKSLQKTSTVTTATLIVISIIALLAEATLGANAIRQFSLKTSFNSSDATPLFIAALISFAVTTPTLLYSAATGYRKGLRFVDADDVELEHRHNLHEQALSEYEKDMAEYESDKKKFDAINDLTNQHTLELLSRRHSAYTQVIDTWLERSSKSLEHHTDALNDRTSRKEEFNSLQRLPDFQAMLKYMSIVETIQVRIEEVEKKLNNEQISRGYKRANLF